MPVLVRDSGSTPLTGLMPGKGSGNGMPFSYGTAAFGRLKYGTDDEAERAADDLGLDSIHQHSMDLDDDGSDETIYMPGGDHDKLNKSLAERGQPPKPGIKAMGSQSDMSSGDAGMLGSDGMAEMMPSKPDKMSNRSETMAGERPEGSSMFRVFGDSDDDDEMEIY